MRMAENLVGRLLWLALLLLIGPQSGVFASGKCFFPSYVKYLKEFYPRQ